MDRNDYFEYICTNPRALVKEAYINDLLISYADIVKGNGHKFEFIQGVLERVNGNNTIDVRKFETNQLDPVTFDYLVIATGSSYNFPIKDIMTPSL